MSRMPRILALLTVLVSSPVLGSNLSRAASEPPATTVSSAPTRPDHTAPNGFVRGASPRMESQAPRTPIPMNLPDNATAEEIKGEYAFGIASLTMGTLLVAALMLGAFYIVARQTWSTQH